MTAKNKVREQIAFVLLAISVIVFLLGLSVGHDWEFLLLPGGGLLFATGAVMYISVAVINGVPWFVRLMSLYAEPVWEGEILHGNGGAFKIRYVFDKHGRAHYVADDICSATGTNPPLKNAQKWGGVPLSRYGEMMCFPESSVQDYLLPLAVKNYEANRLLLLIRNHVMRRLEKERKEQDAISDWRHESRQN